MERLRVGVIGCGGIAQMMHLPYLRELDDRFELVALCDVDAATLALVADHYGVARRHLRVADLLAEPIDAVLILSSGDHTDDTIAALERGLHVFVEKPLSSTLRQTDAVIDATRRADRTLMVGMMKRYDPGYRRGIEAVRELRDLRYVEVRMLHPDDGLYRTHHAILGGRRRGPSSGDAADRLYGADFDQTVQRGILGGAAVDLFREATGSTRPEVLTAYALLLGSSIHDVNALQGIMGQPERVVSAHAWAGGTSYTAVLAYPGGVHATYTWTLLPYLKHYQEELAFFASDGRVQISFPSPYLRNEPTTVDVETMDGGELRLTRLITSYEESFKLELEHFHDCVTQRRPPLTDAAGFHADLEVITAIARAL